MCSNGRMEENCYGNHHQTGQFNEELIKSRARKQRRSNKILINLCELINKFIILY